MRHAPWTADQAKKWANEHVKKCGSGDIPEEAGDFVSFLAGLERAEQAINESQTIYLDGHAAKADTWRLQLDPEFEEYLASAKLVGFQAAGRKEKQ